MGMRTATSCARSAASPSSQLRTALADRAAGGCGAGAGEVAADAALVELGTRFFGAPPDRATSDALAEAMRDANAAVLKAAASSGHRDAATPARAAGVARGAAGTGT